MEGQEIVLGVSQGEVSGQEGGRRGKGGAAPGGGAGRSLLLVGEAIDAPEVTVAPDLAQGRDVVQRALHELADLGDWAAV